MKGINWEECGMCLRNLHELRTMRCGQQDQSVVNEEVGSLLQLYFFAILEG